MHSLFKELFFSFVHLLNSLTVSAIKISSPYIKNLSHLFQLHYFTYLHSLHTFIIPSFSIISIISLYITSMFTPLQAPKHPLHFIRIQKVYKYPFLRSPTFILPFSNSPLLSSSGKWHYTHFLIFPYNSSWFFILIL